METYNTQLPHIQMPQYGRNVQRMIEYCKTVPDRDKRNRIARRIVQAMADLYADNSEGDISKEALWDHLAMMAGYELDIDYPYPIHREEEIATPPARIAYSTNRIHLRNYGKVVEQAIEKACSLPTAEERIQLFELVANQMKRIYHLANKGAAEDDNKIVHDMLDYTGGEHSDEIYQVYLHSAKELLKITQYNPDTVDATKKKKKKKK